MRLFPHLAFPGNCREAFDFYAKVLKGKIAMSMTYGESPMKGHMSADMHDKIIHARLEFGDNQALAGVDAPPERFKKQQGVGIIVYIDSPADAERAFNAFADGGSVGMPFQQTFWAYRFGMVTDKYGTEWMINCEKAP
jgi:PhnB protein